MKFMKLATRTQDAQGGFTLIETLIVVLILGILATIVVIGVGNFESSSASASCQSNFRTLETAAELYKTQEGSYPSAGSTFAVGASDTNAAAALMEKDSGKSVGPWIKDLPYSQGHYQIVVATDGSGAVKVYTAPNVAPATDTGTNGGVLLGSSLSACSSVP
jgi:prepilin-type N-terminal cleavage/methylation domain-containing protein